MKAGKLIRATLLTGFTAGLLTGCSWFEDWPPSGSEMAVKSAPKPPESRIMQTSEGTWIEPDKQAQAAQPKGVAVDPASADRIAQLEQSIEDIRNDLALMMPALTKLAAAQGDLQKILGQVEPASGGAPAAADAASSYQPAEPPVAITQPQAQAQQQQQPPAGVDWYEAQERQNRGQRGAQSAAAQNNGGNAAPSAPPPQQQQAAPVPPPQAYDQAYKPAEAPQNIAVAQAQPYQPAPPAAAQPVSYGGGNLAITGVRFGEHTDKTRLVLDSSDKVAFSYDVDNNERILLIQLPGSGWQGAKDMQVNSSPLVASYSVVSDNAGGHQVIMQLKQPVQVLWAQALAPGGPQGHRVVFDLAPL